MVSVASTPSLCSPHGMQHVCAPSAAMHRSASTPTLRVFGESSRSDDGMEVYVVLRNFQEFAGGVFNRLPGPLREGVRDSGICHYMTVFRSPDGTMTMFDFGPEAGGDIHVGRGPFSRFLNKSSDRRSVRRQVRACVRENTVASLPAPHMYVGRTNLSLADIRAWNEVHAGTEYELHRSDCRHYVNSLVHYSTGVERATTSALRHQWAINREKYGIGGAVLRLGHYMTDVANWERVKAVSNATAAVIAAVTGQQALARLRTASFLRYPLRRVLVQRPMYAVGTAAVATYAASSGQTPAAVRETIGVGSRIANGVQSALRVAAGLAERVGRGATTFTQQTRIQVVTLAGGIAGAASRGASNISGIRRAASHGRVPSVSPRLGLGAQDFVSNRSGGTLCVVMPAGKNDRARRLALASVRR